MFETTTDQELFHYADLLNFNINQIKTKDNFKGKVKEGFYIANLDDITGSGTHWVAFYCVNNMVMYFDSFGLAVPKQIISFCKGNQIIYNVVQIQHIDSEACGYYCIAFFNYFNLIPKSRIKNKKTFGFYFNNFLKPFDVQHIKRNEKILEEQLKSLLNKL